MNRGYNNNYKKQKYGKSSSYPSSTDKKYRTSSDNQLVVYRNPFSMATTNPKIPDGKTSYSCGIRLQAVKEFVNNMSPDMHFVLYPGLKCGLTFIDWHPQDAAQLADDDDANKQNRSVVRNMKYTNLVTWDTTWGDMDAADPAAVVPVGQADVLNIEQGLQDSPMCKWRVVSQGVRFSLTNNSDENDGWWEAIRIPMNTDNVEYGVETAANIVGGDIDRVYVTDDPAVCPRPHIVYSRGSRNWVEHPTYTTGKIRDLHRYLFQLKPANVDHDFVELKTKYPLVGATAISQTVHNTSLHAFINANVDKSFDQILIRMHGRVRNTPGLAPDQQPGVSTETPTRIMAHLVCNMEVVYDDVGFLSRFHTECKSSHKFFQAKKALVESSNAAAQKLKLQYSG